MKKRFTRIMAALALLVFMMPNLVAWGQTRDNYSGTFTRITSVSDFVTGYYVITGSQTASTNNKALGNSVDSNKRIPGVQVSISNNQIQNPDNTVVYYITVDDNSCTFLNVSTNKYMYQASTTSGKGMGFQDEAASITLSGYNSQSPIGFKFTLNGNSNNFLKWNNGSSWYANYANDYSTTMTPVELFKLEETPSTDPVLSVNSSSIDFGSVAINPTSPYEETFEVSFANLTQDLTVTGFEGISVSPATISVGEGTGEATVTVTYAPSAVGELEGNITVSNTDDEVSATVAVTGSAYDPANVDTYEPFTGNIVEGDYVIYDALVAMKNEIVSNRFANQDVEPEDDQIVNPANTIIWHIAPSDGYWTIYNAAVEKYAGGTTTKNQGALLDEVTDYAKWTITYNNGYTFENLGRSQGTADSGNKYLRHNGASGWATYGSGTGSAPALYKKVIANQVATPTFTPAAGTYTEAQNVSIACTTNGATIQYKLTENGDWQTYSSALAISETTTVWAQAIKEGMVDSDVASATYAIELPLNTIPAIFNAATSAGSNVNVTFGNWVVSGVSGSNAFVTDNSGNGFIIYTSNHGFAVNDVLSGTVLGTPLKLYKGSAEFTNLTKTTEGLSVSSNGEITVITDKTIADLGGVNTGAVITLSNLTYDGTNLSDGTNTIKPYNTLFSDMSFTSGKTYNVTGVYQQYDNTKEIMPRSAEDIEEVVVTTPSITVTPSTINAPFAGTDGTLTLTYENIENFISFDYYFCDAEGNELQEGPNWIDAEIQEENDVYSLFYIIDANDGETRTAYIKVYTYDDNLEEVYAIVTINQAEFVVDYATLPFEWDYFGNTPSGITNSGVSTGSNNAYLKFDNSGDYIVLKINERPGTLTFDIKGNPGSDGWAGTFKVQTSADGNTYTNLANYEELPTNDYQSETFATLNENVRYIKWIYETKTSGNVALDNILLAKFIEPTTETHTLTINGYTDVTEGSNNKGYYLIASPVNVDPANVGGMTDGDFDLYYYDDTEELEWRNYETQTFSLVPGTGYLYAKKATTEGETFSFNLTGTPYNGDGVIPTIAGWNLIGNPFGVEAEISADYYAMNQAGSELTPVTASTNVAAMQGVFVYSAEAGSVMFMPAETGTNTGDEKLTLNVTGTRGNVIDRAIVRFGEGRQLPKFQLNAENTKIYFAQGDNDYAVVRSASQADMPVSFKAAENGTYTLSFEADNTEMRYMHLIDNMTGADVDLLSTPSYSFEANTTDYANRFRIVFKANNSINEMSEDRFAFFNGSEWVVSNEGEATLQVIDMMGRVLSSQTINGNANIKVNEAKGVYVIQLTSGNSTKTQKVVVK